MAKLIITLYGTKDDGPLDEEEMARVEKIFKQIRDGMHLTLHREPTEVTIQREATA